ncbi:hypothetical protein, partial [Dietzia sp. UBA5065]|uniref:hypothetical protein n=1 Tax=Dietzia sp. UBA5065 TaxID=1946422 RepID=UPI0025BEA450
MDHSAIAAPEISAFGQRKPEGQHMSAGCAAALPDADAETAPFGHRKPKSQRKPAGAAQVG